MKIGARLVKRQGSEKGRETSSWRIIDKANERNIKYFVFIVCSSSVAQWLNLETVLSVVFHFPTRMYMYETNTIAYTLLCVTLYRSCNYRFIFRCIARTSRILPRLERIVRIHRQTQSNTQTWGGERTWTRAHTQTHSQADEGGMGTRWSSVEKAFTSCSNAHSMPFIYVLIKTSPLHNCISVSVHCSIRMHVRLCVWMENSAPSAACSVFTNTQTHTTNTMPLPLMVAFHASVRATTLDALATLGSFVYSLSEGISLLIAQLYNKIPKTNPLRTHTCAIFLSNVRSHQTRKHNDSKCVCVCICIVAPLAVNCCLISEFCVH